MAIETQDLNPDAMPSTTGSSWSTLYCGPAAPCTVSWARQERAGQILDDKRWDKDMVDVDAEHPQVVTSVLHYWGESGIVENLSVMGAAPAFGKDLGEAGPVVNNALQDDQEQALAVDKLLDT